MNQQEIDTQDPQESKIRSQSSIRADVIAYIASFANMKITSIKDEHILKNHPLKLDDTKLGFLAIALRAYLRNINPNETVLASEIRKKDMDVKKTYELIIEKANVRNIIEKISV